MIEMTPERLDEIEARADAATLGPWDIGPMWEDGEIWVESDPNVEGGYPIFGGDESMLRNLEFAASARQDVPDLVAEVRRLQAENAELRNRNTKAILDEMTREAYESGQYGDED